MKILYFAPVYYDDMKQRPQQIAECLALKHDVYYVEPTVSLLRWLLRGGRSFMGIKKRLYNGLKVIRLNGCLTFHKSMEILDLCGINSWYELWQLRKLIKECDLVWVGYSGWYTIVRHIKTKPVIFDKMDEEDMLVSSSIWKLTLRRNQKKLFQMSDAVMVTCQQFYDRYKDKKKKVFLIPNAVSDRFASGITLQDTCFKKLHKIKTFGYIGTIGEWFDVDVIDKILKMDDRYEVYLVGRNYLPRIDNLRVHYLGIRKNKELSKIIQTFDVCLYNFKQSPILDTINPVKIYEYLSLNKPVLAVSSKETLRLRKYLEIYENVDKIETIIRNGLKPPFTDIKSLQQFIKENSWVARTEQIEQILREEIRNYEKGDVSLWNKARSSKDVSSCKRDGKTS
jgi:hypothetical protein